MAQRGGKRPGSGRPKGAKDRATAELRVSISEAAKAHTELALKVLVQVATSSESDAARVSAANAILDRGYGKPLQQSTVTIDDKRDATDWTRAELVAFLRDRGTGGGRVAEENGRGREPDSVH